MGRVGGFGCRWGRWLWLVGVVSLDGLACVAFYECDEVFGDAHVVEFCDFDEVFFDGWGEFDCECWGVCGFSAGSVHFGFVIWLMSCRDVMRKRARRMMSILNIFVLYFFSDFL